MKYETITVHNFMDDTDTEHIVIEREDGSFESFPADTENPRYQAFLTELETAK